MANPFERKFSMTPAEEEGLKKEGRSPQQIAEAKKRFEEATKKNQMAGVPDTEELSTSEVKKAFEEVDKYSKEKYS